MLNNIGQPGLLLILPGIVSAITLPQPVVATVAVIVTLAAI